jgi:hypothetical protein
MKYLLLMLSACLMGCSERVTPIEETRSAIGETFVRINMYAEANKKLPASIEILPRRAGYANQIIDGWGNKLKYTISKDGLITITSFGADGEPGGVAENADISVSYRSKRPDGSFWAGSKMWIVEAKEK